MWINKSTSRVLRLFAGHITETFTLREAARNLNMHVSLMHRAVQPLIKAKIIKHDKHKNLSLDYKIHHETLAYAEYLSREEYFDRFQAMKMFADDVYKKIRKECFVLLVFGSSVISKKPRDIDVILIIDSTKEIEFHEKFISNVAGNYSLSLHILVLSYESVYEMLAAHDEKNVMNEVLNKHIILHGAELFYRLIQRGRK